VQILRFLEAMEELPNFDPLITTLVLLVGKMESTTDTKVRYLISF
jgi:hypothetical protein